MIRLRAPARLVLLPFGLALLVSSILGGLARFGSDVPASTASVTSHGILAVLGFFGMLVSLERIVVLRERWAITAPLLALTASGLLLAGIEVRLVGCVYVLAGIATGVVVYRIGVVGKRTAAHEQMLVACAAWVAAATLWAMSASTSTVAPFLATFLTLTITGERTQLGKLGFRPRTRVVTRALAALLTLSLVVTLIDADIGTRLVGLCFMFYALWLLNADARRRLRRPGLMSFMANVLIGGLLWLVVAGALWIMNGAIDGSARSDAALHALFVGFVMSMVFAHAAMVFPAITQIRVPYYRVFYVHVALLHVGMVVRVTGDLRADVGLARTGAELTALAIGLFLLATATSAVAALLGFAPARPPRQAPVASRARALTAADANEPPDAGS